MFGKNYFIIPFVALVTNEIFVIITYKDSLELI